MVVGAKACEFTDGFLWFVRGNFVVSPKLSVSCVFELFTISSRIKS